MSWHSLWSLVDHDEILTGLRMGTVEDSTQLQIVGRREPVQAKVIAALDVRLAVRDLLRRNARCREHLHQVRAGQALDRSRIRDLVDASTNEQVPRQRSRRRVLDHLPDLELVIARSGLQEEVVRQVFDKVTGRENVVAGPGSPLRVLWQGSLPA